MLRKKNTISEILTVVAIQFLTTRWNQLELTGPLKAGFIVGNSFKGLIATYCYIDNQWQADLRSHASVAREAKKHGIGGRMDKWKNKD